MTQSDWKESTLGELLEYKKGFAFPAGCFTKAGGRRIIRVSDTTANSIAGDDPVYISEAEAATYSAYELHENDIIVTTVGSRPPMYTSMVGKAIKVPRSISKALLNQNMVKLIPKAERLLPVYLYSLLRTKRFIYHISGAARGNANQASITLDDIFAFPLLLPPISEQSKIAEILTCWDKAIELVERLIEEKRTLKKSLSQRIFFSKHRPTISADSEWITVELRNLLEVSKDKEPISETRPLFSLTIEHGVTPKTDRYDREALVKDKVAKLYKVVNPMDIVFNPSNLRWGAIGLCRQETPVLVSPIYEVVRVKDPKSTSTEFLFQLLSSERQINFFATLTEGTLIERMAVKVDTFLDQTVCIPSRREDQDALAAILALADREISSLAQLDIELKQQKRGLMQQLLTGKIRVKV